jgi:vacuolar-type H+-ATPase subunit I/STV1
MKQVDRETMIQLELTQLDLEQESNQRERRKLAEAEYEYREIQNREQRFYQELMEANQGAEKQHYFVELEAESRSLQEKQRQQIEEYSEELLAEKKNLMDMEDQMYLERKNLLDQEVGAGEWVQKQWLDYVQMKLDIIGINTNMNLSLFPQVKTQKHWLGSKKFWQSET